MRMKLLFILLISSPLLAGGDNEGFIKWSLDKANEFVVPIRTMTMDPNSKVSTKSHESEPSVEFCGCSPRALLLLVVMAGAGAFAKVSASKLASKTD